MNSQNLNKDLLATVAADSIAQLANSNHKHAQRWINAIAKAVVELETNALWNYEIESHTLLMVSNQSYNVYEANGVCQCKAFAHGMPCVHRAMSRLILRYIEAAK